MPDPKSVHPTHGPIPTFAKVGETPHTYDIRVFLNGEEIDNCVEADTERGYAERMLPEVPPGADTWPTYIEYGEVRLEWAAEK